MRGQEYTVMNYLVWAAFAAAFLLAAYGAYHAVASRGCSVGMSQVVRLIEDAGKMQSGCVYSHGRVALCDGATFTVDLVKRLSGAKSAEICWGVGFKKQSATNKIAVVANGSVQAMIAACRDGSVVRLCLNNPACAFSSSGSSSCISG